MDNEIIKKYLSNLFNWKLTKNEDICLVFINSHATINNEKKEIVFERYVHTFDEAIIEIEKYNAFCNCYVSLATCKDKTRTKETVIKRRCIALDFDRKDFNEQFNMQNAIALLNEYLNGLYYHIIFDTSGGYHFYIFTETTKDIKRLAKINYDLAGKCKADLSACLETQIMRIPSTYNCKTEKKKLVKVIHDGTTSPKFKVYKLDDIKRRFLRDFEYNPEERVIKTQISGINIDGMYCVNEMLKGVPKGHRNFALGRITKAMQYKNYNKEQTKDVILQWNDKCNPPKSENELLTDFNSYWDTDYKLLGCNTNQESIQSILANYCDKFACTKFDKSEIIITGVCAEFNNKYFKEWRKLTGNHLILLAILNVNKQGLNTKQLEKEITSTITKKPCMSDKTFKKYLRELVEYNFITCLESPRKNEPNFYKINDKENKYRKYTYVSYQSVQRTIDKAIRPSDFKVYACMMYRLQRKENVTMENLAKELNIDLSCVWESIHNLENARYLNIRKDFSVTNLGANIYELLI